MNWQIVMVIAIGSTALTIMFIAATKAYSKLGIAAFQSERHGAPKSFGLVWNRTARLSTVVLIVVATIVLALTGKLTEGAAAILSGIAGYVLGGADDASKNDAKEDP